MMALSWLTASRLPAGVLKTQPDELDALVTLGVKEGHLHLVA